MYTSNVTNNIKHYSLSDMSQKYLRKIVNYDQKLLRNFTDTESEYSPFTNENYDSFFEK
jgi:hypothetical protein